MTTYGPDINVSFPEEITQKLFGNIDDLHLKVNYYAPAMAALSLAAPFFGGAPWIIKGERGKSFRTFKRSVIAPAIELQRREPSPCGAAAGLTGNTLNRLKAGHVEPVVVGRTNPQIRHIAAAHATQARWPSAVASLQR